MPERGESSNSSGEGLSDQSPTVQLVILQLAWHSGSVLHTISNQACLRKHGASIYPAEESKQLQCSMMWLLRLFKYGFEVLTCGMYAIPDMHTCTLRM